MTSRFWSTLTAELSVKACWAEFPFPLLWELAWPLLVLSDVLAADAEYFDAVADQVG
ncbi:hypothetical protein IPZ70_15865 [Streptomyces polychromogenes]|nr:hypothetical protein [Streptomyces polychromogenes]